MIRSRFSPSPTGLLHLGNARTALFSALFAAHSDGLFVLRIEDTDAARSDHQFTDLLQDDLHWLGIQWQEGPGVHGPHSPYWQSQRQEIYAQYYQKLQELGRVYPCFCSDQELALNRKIQLSRGQAPRYPGTCRSFTQEDINKRLAEGKKPTLRFRVPTQTIIEFNDLVKGIQRFNTDDIGDFIIRRADESSSFLFCNAIDDSLMKITHVIRGEDHLANTPRQLMILQALNMHSPQYAHLSLITGDDGAPLSKRHGSFSLTDLRTQGFLTSAVLNYLARLSHSYEQQRLLSFAELAKDFHLEKISRSSARFDNNQLFHWQKEAIAALDIPAVWQWLGEEIQQKVPADKQALFAKVMKENILFPKEALAWADILFTKELEFSPEKIAILQEAGEDFFILAQSSLQQHGTDVKAILDELKNKLSLSGKKLFMPMRVALTGEQHGAELAHIATLLGQEKILHRLQQAQKLFTKD